MSKGQLALVLHSHLPYVRSEEAGSLEEDWYYQALMECYLPILETLEKASTNQGQVPKITISLSPTLLSLFEDSHLKQNFSSWASSRLDLLSNISNELILPASHLASHISHQLKIWETSNGEVINRFAKLQRSGVIDILTCAATHGYLPLLRQNPESVRGQLKTAVREHLRIFDVPPIGIWLPECAYYEGLDALMVESGLRYAVLDGHGLLHANPRPRYGLYAPICSKSGVAFFGRDSESTLPVWSAKEGYPGHPEYREFHKDLGWEIKGEKLIQLGLKGNRPLGLKLHKVTGQNIPLDEKEVYDPYKAKECIKKHANKYIKERCIQLDKLYTTMNHSPLLIAPFDTELFGHWWFEGPLFLEEIFTNAAKNDLHLTRLCDTLQGNPKLQLCEPCPSSWGQGGYHDYWLNKSNDWVVIEWNNSSKAMIERCKIGVSNQDNLRLLQQAARELLLSQSSDWSFILRAGTTTELAKERINRHLKRFWTLINALDSEDAIPSSLLNQIEKEDSLFPLIQAKDWT